ncbi:hypothetical protein GALMADRAFT_135142 [Galerina marginata CBS 339.88]|uniref:NECAP PHear domain-containing protein n=1 Tax=Galerina marginata (strain CBS 339.88) TaxID=685588 RepID=A0A067THA4_GALM3|nr:hypothetical protein GALMADRAFT_135142 [Galerina marginata CBS 339.88]
MDVEDDIDSILYIAREISVYKIPPLNANEGYRANDWGDLASPLWKGRLRIIENSKGASLNLEDAQTGELFARAEYDPTRPSVEAVLDSSRYFVVRVEDSGKKAYIGLGFAERTDSFDFNVALQDYTKRTRAALNSTSDSNEVSPHIPAGPKKDYSLKEGQTFSISIPGRAKAATNDNLLGSTSSSSTANASTIPLLPPPPSAAKRR